MAFVFDPDPDLDEALKKRFVAPPFRPREDQAIRDYLSQHGTIPKQQPPAPQETMEPVGRAAQSHDPLLQAAAQARAKAQSYDKGVAAAVAMTDAAQAEDEVASALPAATIAGNVAQAQESPPVKANAERPVTSTVDLTPARATTFYDAVQQMDPLGQAVIAHALGVPTDVFKTKEETEIEKRSAAAVLRWRTAMDDPNSPERKSLDAGDLTGFSKMAMSAGAMDPVQGINLLAQIRSDDEQRNAYGFDVKTYSQALVPVMSKSATLVNQELAMMGTDAKGEPAASVDADGRVIQFDVAKVLTSSGAVDDVMRSVSVAAADDILGTRDMRPYVMAGNTAFFDQIGTYLSNNLNVDPATGTATLADFVDTGFFGQGGTEPTAALTKNLTDYIKYQRVALVASRRYSPESVAAMDDMQVMSIATGKPRIAALMDSEQNVILGDAKTILQQQTLFAPNGFNAILQQTLPKTSATPGAAKPAEKKP